MQAAPDDQDFPAALLVEMRQGRNEIAVPGEQDDASVGLAPSPRLGASRGHNGGLLSKARASIAREDVGRVVSRRAFA